MLCAKLLVINDISDQVNVTDAMFAAVDNSSRVVLLKAMCNYSLDL